MNKSIKLPFSARLALVFINLFAIVFSLYIAQGILIPIIMATIFAVLLNPIVNYLESKKINKLVAISITVFVGLLIVLGLLFFLVSQATSFSEALPMLKTKFNKSSADLIAWIAEKCGKQLCFKPHEYPRPPTYQLSLIITRNISP